jgi:triosephosphate isomerase (TIM)
MRPLIAGNWKMHGLRAELHEIESIAAVATRAQPHVDILICPPASLLAAAARTAGGRIAVGGQDCDPEASRAHAGDVSAEMLKDAGAVAVIVGHSKRRQSITARPTQSSPARLWPQGGRDCSRSSASAKRNSNA